MTRKKTKHLVKRASPGVGEFVAITVFAKSDDVGLDDCRVMGGVMSGRCFFPLCTWFSPIVFGC